MPFTISKVEVQGAKDTKEWPYKFCLSFSTDGSEFIPIYNLDESCSVSHSGASKYMWLVGRGSGSREFVVSTTSTTPRETPDLKKKFPVKNVRRRCYCQRNSCCDITLHTTRHTWSALAEAEIEARIRLGKGRANFVAVVYSLKWSVTPSFHRSLPYFNKKQKSIEATNI